MRSFRCVFGPHEIDTCVPIPRIFRCLRCANRASPLSLLFGWTFFNSIGVRPVGSLPTLGFHVGAISIPDQTSSGIVCTCKPQAISQKTPGWFLRDFGHRVAKSGLRVHLRASALYSSALVGPRAPVLHRAGSHGRCYLSTAPFLSPTNRGRQRASAAGSLSCNRKQSLSQH